MNCLNKCILALVATGLLFSSCFAYAANPNQVGLVIISDPHVDVKLTKSAPINPERGVSKELDSRSYEAMISKIGTYMDTYPERTQAVVLLGDLPAHNAYRQKTSTANISLVLEKYYEKLSPTPLFYVFGNNDSPERNYGKFSNGDKSTYNLFGSINGSGNGFISTGLLCPYAGTACIDQENNDKGYYSAYVGDHLKMLSLNSVIFVSRPSFSPSRDGDSAQMTWLHDEIKASKARHDNIILAMHVPPQQWETKYQTSFKNILKAYPSVVVGMMAAHTHYDEIHAFKISSSGKTYIIPVVYSAGLGTDHGNASSFKTMLLSRSSQSSAWSIKDYSTYNFIGRSASSSVMNKYYDFDKAFCPNDSSINVAQCLKSHIQSDKFDSKTSTLMSKHYTAGNPNNSQSTNPSSKWVVSF